MYLATRQFWAIIIGACSAGILLGIWISQSNYRYTTIKVLIPSANRYEVFLQITELCAVQDISSISSCTSNYKNLWIDTNIANYNYYVIDRYTEERVLINE